MTEFRFDKYWKLWSGGIGAIIGSILSILTVFFALPDGVTATSIVDAITKLAEAGDAVIVAAGALFTTVSALVGVVFGPKNSE